MSVTPSPKTPPPATMGFVSCRYSHATRISHSAMGLYILPAAPPGVSLKAAINYYRSLLFFRKSPVLNMIKGETGGRTQIDSGWAG